MGFWARLLRKSEVVEAMDRRFEETLTLVTTPHDPELWKIAEARKHHISMKAVADEYQRLVLEKHHRR
jgi:hypothetical protein